MRILRDPITKEILEPKVGNDLSLIKTNTPHLEELQNKIKSLSTLVLRTATTQKCLS